MHILRHERSDEVEVFAECTHPDGKSNGADLHWRDVVWFSLRPRLCPHVGQLYAPLLQGDAAALEVGLLVEHPAATENKNGL